MAKDKIMKIADFQCCPVFCNVTSLNMLKKGKRASRILPSDIVKKYEESETTENRSDTFTVFSKDRY